MLVPQVPCEGPVLHSREIRDDISASGGQESERGLCNDARVHDDRDGRVGGEADFLPAFHDGRAGRHDAVVARRRGHAHEGHARIEGGTLGHINRPAPAHTHGEVEIGLVDLLLARPHLLPSRPRDQELMDFHLARSELRRNRVPRDLHRQFVGYEEGAPAELEGVANLSDLQQRIVTYDHLPGQLHGFRLGEGLHVHGCHAITSPGRLERDVPT